MEYHDKNDFENINFQIESSSRMIDLGNFTKSFELCEPPRLYRRVIYLSQAAMPDRIKLS